MNYRVRGDVRLWWIPFLTGLLGIGLGVWCLLSPTTSLPFLSYAFAACLCLAGVMNMVYACVNTKSHPGWGWSLALGLLEAGCGAWMFCLPEAQVVQTFIFVVGIWILVVAINAVAESVMYASYSPFLMVWMVLLSIAAGVFAVIFLSNPVSGGVAVWLWIGLSLIFYGCYRLVFAFQVKRISRNYNRR